MASSLASIAETWPENVLPCSLRSRPREAIVSRKCASQKIFARPYTDILRVRMDFLHEVQFSAAIEAAHFPAETTRPLGRGCLPFSPSFQWTHRPPISHFLIFSFLIFLHKAIPVSKSSIICKFLIYKTFIVFVKASWSKDSKGLVVLTTVHSIVGRCSLILHRHFFYFECVTTTMENSRMH